VKRDNKFRFSVRCDAAGFVTPFVLKDLNTFKALGTTNLATERQIAEELTPPTHRCGNRKYCNREDEERAERKRGIRLTFWHRSFTFNSNKSPT
jgi:hypothetical protein